MIDKRFLYVIDNGEDTIYDLLKKNILSKKDIEDKMNALYEENEQLKQLQASTLQELRIYRKIATCRNCKHQDYDWFEDGDEFEICEKGNTDQQIEYHICEEWEEFK